MKKYIQFLIVLQFFGMTQLMAQPMPPDDSEGYTDQTFFRSDGIHLNNDVMDQDRHRRDRQREPNRNQQMGRSSMGFSIGANMYYSDTYNIYSLPIGYEGLDDWVFSCNIPLVIVEYQGTTDYSQYGLGDITLGVSYDFPQWNENFSINLSTEVALPTGKVDAMDGDQNVPLGSGSTLSYFNLALNQDWPKFSLHGNVGYGFFWYKADYTVPVGGVDTRYIMGKGWTLTNLIGAEYQLWDRFMATAKVYSSLNTETFVEERTPAHVINYEANDSLIASDLLLGGRIKLFNDTAFTLTCAIPVFTIFDEDLASPAPRKIGISAGISAFL